MTEPDSISCAECQSRLEEFALDELSGELRTRVAEHLAGGCSVCNQQLSDLVNDFALLAYSLPFERPPLRVEQGLLNRITAQGSAHEASVSPRSTAAGGKISQRWLTGGLMAAALALAASLLGLAAWTTRHERTNGPQPATDEWAELQRRVDQANASQQFPAIPQMHFASLGTRKLETSVDGYIVHDDLARQWHVYAFHLPPLSGGHVYQLWLDVGNSKFVRAGTAEVDSDGTISRVIDMPTDLAEVRGLAISDEPSNDAERPTVENLVEAPLP